LNLLKFYFFAFPHILLSSSRIWITSHHFIKIHTHFNASHADERAVFDGSARQAGVDQRNGCGAAAGARRTPSIGAAAAAASRAPKLALICAFNPTECLFRALSTHRSITDAMIKSKGSFDNN
jgi:hypothetical protein